MQTLQKYRNFPQSCLVPSHSPEIQRSSHKWQGWTTKLKWLVGFLKHRLYAWYIYYTYMYLIYSILSYIYIYIYLDDSICTCVVPTKTQLHWCLHCYESIWKHAKKQLRHPHPHLNIAGVIPFLLFVSHTSFYKHGTVPYFKYGHIFVVDM